MGVVVEDEGGEDFAGPGVGAVDLERRRGREGGERAGGGWANAIEGYVL